MDTNYSRICNHPRLSRIDPNFVRCLACGVTLVSQQNALINKKQKDFSNENKSFMRNFDRNFSNNIEQTDDQPHLLEYYIDKHKTNVVIVDRTRSFFSDPPKYKTTINGQTSFLFAEQINKLLNDIKAIRVDRRQVT